MAPPSFAADMPSQQAAAQVVVRAVAPEAVQEAQVGPEEVLAELGAVA